MTVVVAEARGAAAPTPLASVRPPQSDAALRWSRFLPATRAEGPGVRAALWLQGCSVRCPGCFNPHLWAARGGILSSPADAAADWIAQARAAAATGLTLLGGEPFDQAGAAAEVAHAFRAAGFDVMTFTGYRLADLDAWAAGRPDIAALLAQTDLLCDGPYLRDQRDDARPWIGSRNQSIRALSEMHREAVEQIAARGGSDSLEIRIGADGAVQVNGWASDEALAALLDDLGVRADRPSSSLPTRPERAA